jgi:hypothetical protein
MYVAPIANVATKPTGAALAQRRGRGYLERANLLTGGALNNAGTTQFSKELPMGEGWYAMYLRFNYAVTIGTGAGPVTEGELMFIRQVLLRTDRSEIICNLPGRALFRYANWITKCVPNKNAIAAATATYRVTLPIFFADWTLLRPEDTVLDTSRYNSVTLQITLGPLTDLFTAPGTAVVVSTMDIEVERSLGRLPDKALPVMHINYDSRQTVDASTTTSIDIERSSDLALKRIFVSSVTSGTIGLPWFGVMADSIQNVIQIQDQNRFIEKDRVHAMIQDENKMDQSLEALIVGMEGYDFVRDGSLTAALSTGLKSKLTYSWTNQGGVAANSIITLTQEGVRTLK